MKVFTLIKAAPGYGFARTQQTMRKLHKRDAQSPAPANAAAPGLAMATGDPSPVAPVQPTAPDLYDDDVPF